MANTINDNQDLGNLREAFGMPGSNSINTNTQDTAKTTGFDQNKHHDNLNKLKNSYNRIEKDGKITTEITNDKLSKLKNRQTNTAATQERPSQTNGLLSNKVLENKESIKIKTFEKMGSITMKPTMLKPDNANTTTQEFDFKGEKDFNSVEMKKTEKADLYGYALTKDSSVKDKKNSTPPSKDIQINMTGFEQKNKEKVEKEAKKNTTMNDMESKLNDMMN